jgi:hypothetical protein
MAATSTRQINVLVGPTCPTCESDDLRWGAPLGALWQGQCRDCGTEYRAYEPPLGDGDQPEPTCPACGLPHDEEDTGSPFCEDCHLSDCAYCGFTTHIWMLSENLACRVCEEGEVA